MTDQEIRIAIAETCGFRDIKVRTRYNGIQDYEALCGEQDGIVQELPNYPEDLNAIHEAEKTLTGEQCLKYVEELNKTTKCFKHITPAVMIFATARQRAEAFLRTLNKQKD